MIEMKNFKRKMVIDIRSKVVEEVYVWLGLML